MATGPSSSKGPFAAPGKRRAFSHTPYYDAVFSQKIAYNSGGVAKLMKVCEVMGTTLYSGRNLGR